jgi:SAM-dependent methyltransferase
MVKTADHRSIFNKIYQTDAWGGGSGIGSFAQNTGEYRLFLESFLKENKVKSVLDVGCGDWQFSSLIDWSGIDYTGIDVSDVVLANTQKYTKHGIKFIHLDAVTDDLPVADLLIIKDVMQHWSNSDILSFVSKLKKFKWSLITNGFHPDLTTHVNKDIVPGGWRPVDLLSEPFKIEGRNVFWWLVQRTELKRTFLHSTGGDALNQGFFSASRNAPCPCGSGARYKHCHGKFL